MWKDGKWWQSQGELEKDAEFSLSPCMGAGSNEIHCLDCKRKSSNAQ